MFPRRSSGSSRSVVLVGGLILLVALAVGAYVMVGTDILSPAPIKKVGSIDYEAVLALDLFKKAEEDFNTYLKEMEAKGEAIAKDTTKDDQEKTLDIQKLQMEIEKERNARFNPLKTRAEAAVAAVARQRKMTVVLDKRIVVYGVPDITEDVTKLLSSGEEIELPAEEDTAAAPIGYFDQEVVRSLKVFQEADLKVYTTRQELMKEFEKRAKDMNAAAVEALKKELSVRFEARQEQIMQPLIQKVNQSVQKSADEGTLSLVLDKQHVMYGGRNITDQVVERFLASVSAPGEEPAE